MDRHTLVTTAATVIILLALHTIYSRLDNYRWGQLAKYQQNQCLPVATPTPMITAWTGAAPCICTIEPQWAGQQIEIGTNKKER